jgi:hypothetical protein
MNSKQRRTTDRKFHNLIKGLGRVLEEQIEEWSKPEVTKETILKEFEKCIKGAKELHGK